MSVRKRLRKVLRMSERKVLRMSARKVLKKVLKRCLRGRAGLFLGVETLSDGF